MLRPTKRQSGRQWQSLLAVISLVIAAQGCSTFQKEKRSTDSPKVGTARVRLKDSSLEVAAQQKSSISSQQRLDQPAKSEPASSEQVETAASNDLGDDHLLLIANSVNSKPTSQIQRTSFSKSKPAQQPTTLIHDSEILPASFEETAVAADLLTVEDATVPEPPRNSSRHRVSTLNTASQFDDLQQFGFRPADEFAQAQVVVPEPEDPKPEDPEPENPKPENPEPPQVRAATPPSPRPPRPVHIPLEGDDATKDIKLTLRNGRVSLVTREVPVTSVLNLLAQQQGVNLITSDDVTANVSVSLSDVSFEDALNSIVAIAGCNWTEQKGIVLVTKVGTDGSSSPAVTGKVVEVFPLNFVSATDIEATVKGLLSPMGQIFVTQVSPTDKRRTQEHVVVEDTPTSLARIARLIGQLDQPPRQVMIEAHILQVELKDDTRHGINWANIIRLSGGDLSLSTVGFASAAASPASFLSFNGDRLDVLVEALKSTTDTKTLASPKIIVANGQEARIQIGERLGYFVTTTTQTSTLQNVNFLDTGVVMRVTPQISQDNRVLMTVRPEVSSGRITALGLPETQTTEANTTVLVEDGGGMVIGGLIKETDLDTQNKVPVLGDIWWVGRAFQRRSLSRVRSEIVIVLIPRIAPYKPDYSAVEQAEVAKAQVKLFHGALQKENRPWEPKLPDAVSNPRRLRVNRLESLFENPKYSDPKPLRYYFPTAAEECPPGWVPDSYEEIPSVPLPEPVAPEPVIQTSDTLRESFPSASRVR